MKTPRLTWAEFKDADGNWKASVLPADQIRALWARQVDMERERSVLAARMAALAAECDRQTVLIRELEATLTALRLTLADAGPADDDRDTEG